jgi:hypothetical protein
MAASTLYSIQQLRGKSAVFDEIISKYHSVSEHIDTDVSFLEGHYQPSLNLVPMKYREFVQRRLSNFIHTKMEVEKLEAFNLYPGNPTT